MKTRKSKCAPVLGAPDDIMPRDDLHLTAEQWMDLEFGPGTWVRDTWCDRFITYDWSYDGPGIAYLVLDRDRRRATTIVLPHQVN